MKHLAPAWLLVALLVLNATGAMAQQSVEPTEAQYELYRRAHEAFAGGDYATAARLLRSAIDLGEVNIFYLSLGRAHFRAGRCREAVQAYEHASKAPSVAAPSPAEVARKLEAYRKDLQQDCPGSLAVSCEPAAMQIRVGEGQARACDGGPIELPAGEHVVIGEVEGRRTTRKVRIDPLKEVRLKLELPAVAPAEPRPRKRAPPESGRAEPSTVAPSSALGLDTLGWVALGVGAGALLAAVIIDGPVLGNAIDEFYKSAQSGDGRALALSDDVAQLQAAALGTYIAGGVLAATGGVLLIVASQQRPDEPGVSFWVAPLGGRLEVCF